MKVLIFSENKFKDSILPKIEQFEDTFFISILDPDEPKALRENSDIYKTFWFWDIEQDFENGTDRPYKAITEEQAKEMFDFIKQNKDKKQFIVHCGAGISRSGAVGSFVHEYFGGKYKELLKYFPNILPNGRVTRMLRMYDRLDNMGDLKIQF